jgi:hypothetical protein
MTHRPLRTNRPPKRMDGEPLRWNGGPKRSTDASWRMDDQPPRWNDGPKRSIDALSEDDRCSDKDNRRTIWTHGRMRTGPCMDLCDSRMDLNRSNQEPWKMNDGPKWFSDALARMIDEPEQVHRWSSEDEQLSYQIERIGFGNEVLIRTTEGCADACLPTGRKGAHPSWNANDGLRASAHPMSLSNQHGQWLYRLGIINKSCQLKKV